RRVTHQQDEVVEHSEKANASGGSGRPVEEVLVEIWMEVLGLEHISIHDNFFEMGGHSLLATQLLARIGVAFQVEVSLSMLFQAPTPAACATLIAQSKARPVDSEVALPLLPLVVPNPGQRYVPFP